MTPLRLRDVPSSDATTTITKGLRLLSPRVGILQGLGTGVQYSGDPLLHVIGNRAADASRLGQGVVSHRDSSGGAGLSLATALAAAVGEVVERYCMRFSDRDALVYGSFDELQRGYSLVHPEMARLHSEAQIRDKGGTQSIGGYGRVDYFDERTKLNWIPGFSLTSHQWTLIPAHIVYLPYKAAPTEAKTGWNSSTGLAAGNTLEEAILSGIYEWIERDAFVTCWLHRWLPKRVQVDVPRFQQLLERQFNASHPDVHLSIFDTTLDIAVPSMFVWMVRQMEYGPVCFVGAASRLDPQAALEKALVELAQCIPYSRHNLQRMTGWHPKPDFSDIRSFTHHAVFYLKRFDLVEPAFEFCRRVPNEAPLSQLPNRSTGSVLGDVTACVQELQRHGHEVLVVDLTTADVADVGLRAVRVIVPGLANLHGNHSWPCLGVKRVFQVPVTLDWASQGWNPTAGLNPFPHPFP